MLEEGEMPWDWEEDGVWVVPASKLFAVHRQRRGPNLHGSAAAQ